MDGLIVDLVGKGIVLPLVLSFVLAGSIRAALGPSNGRNFAFGAVGFTYIALYGWLPFPPVASGQKIVYLTMIGLIIGLLLDLRPKARILQRLATIVWPGIVVGWLGWRQLTTLSPDALLHLGILWMAGIFVLLQLFRNRGPGPESSIVVLVAALGVSLVALFGASGSVSQQFGVIAAAMGGFILWNWPTPRFAFGALGAIGLGGVLTALATQTVLFTDAGKTALAITLIVFLTPLLADRVRFAERPALVAVIFGFVAAVPAILASVVAFITTGDSFELPI
jgi:hypothetical protein